MLSAVLAIVLFRLGNMHLEGLLPFGGIVLGLLFGFTSLILNRARAYPPGATQRRSLLAGELSFRATLTYTLGAVLTTFIYYVLSNFGYHTTPLNNYPTQIVPTIFAFVPLMFCTVSIIMLSQTTRLLLRGMRGRMLPRRFIKQL